MAEEILLVAAENSAETYASQLLAEVKRTNRKWHFWGVGGEKLRRAGMEVVCDNENLGVVGIFEVLSAIWRLKRVKDMLLKEVLRRGCRYALLIDYPDFNLKLAADLKRNGVKVFYYIPPTVWAWRYQRVKLLKKYCRHLFIIFPFEEKIYQREEIPFTLLQHPLLSNWQDNLLSRDFFLKNNLDDKKKLITFLPGSRKSEVRRLADIMCAVGQMLQKEFSDVQFALLKADTIPEELLAGFKKGLSITLFPQSQRQELLANSSLVISSCGTATLETALSRVPLIVLYKVNLFSYLLGISFVKIRNYSIVNILNGEQLAKEFIQKDCQPEKIFAEARRLLTDSVYRQEMLEKFAKIKEQLQKEVNAEQQIVALLSEYIRD